MGKIFYGTHADKETAMQLADTYAKKYKKGVCFTPSSRIPNSCSFDPASSLWTCRAAAHHQWGSCGSKEISSNRGKGREWNVNIPITRWNERSPSDAGGGLVQSDQHELNDDTYINAAPEDYSS
jgi:hypothetical protein